MKVNWGGGIYGKKIIKFLCYKETERQRDRGTERQRGIDRDRETERHRDREA